MLLQSETHWQLTSTYRKPPSQSGIKPETFLLWGDCANYCNTVAPWLRLWNLTVSLYGVVTDLRLDGGTLGKLWIFSSGNHYGGRCQTTGLSACSVSCDREGWHVLQRKFSPADALCWKPWRSLPWMEQEGWHYSGSIGRGSVIFLYSHDAI